MYLRAAKKYSNDCSLQDPIGMDREGNAITLESKLADDADDVADQIHDRIESGKIGPLVAGTLHGRERTIIELRYALERDEEMTQREIAHLLGISRSYVSRIEKRAMKKLRKELEAP